MRRSEMILAGVLGVCILSMAGRRAVIDYIDTPISQRKQSIKSLQEEIHRYELQCAKVSLAKRKLTSAKSLAAGDEVASTTIYQNWLLALGQTHQLKQLVVTPRSVDTATQKKYSRVPFTLQATTSVAHWRDFLIAFYRTPLQHRISNMQLQVLESDRNVELMVSMNIELLSVDSDGKSAQELPAQLAKNDAEAFRQRKEKDYAGLNDRGMFAKYIPPIKKKPPTKVARRSTRPAKSKPKSTPPPRPKPDPGRHVVFIGGVLSHERREAWLYDRSQKRETVLVEGKSFNIAGRSGKVTSVASDHVIIEIDGKSKILTEWQNLTQLKESDQSLHLTRNDD